MGNNSEAYRTSDGGGQSDVTAHIGHQTGWSV